MDYYNFISLNKQALDYLQEKNEPETALELLKQALPRKTYQSKFTPYLVSTEDKQTIANSTEQSDQLEKIEN